MGTVEYGGRRLVTAQMALNSKSRAYWRSWYAVGDRAMSPVLIARMVLPSRVIVSRFSIIVAV